MENLVLYMAQALVDHPEDVKVERIENSKDVTLKLSVNPDDMGKVIGKNGRIAQSIRTVVKAAAVKENRKIHYNVDIV